MDCLNAIVKVVVGSDGQTMNTSIGYNQSVVFMDLYGGQENCTV